MPPFLETSRFLALSTVLLIPAAVRAQAVPRTDTPRAGQVRVSFAPTVTTWDEEFSGGTRQPIGASLYIEGPPAFACDTIGGWFACRYSVPVYVRSERRETPLSAEVGVTDRLAIGVRLSAVRLWVQARHDSSTLGQRLNSVLTDSTYAFAPIQNTRRHQRYYAGDFEVGAKYRLLVSTNAATSIGAVVRLPTGHQDSPHDLFDLSTGDHQTDLEVHVTQELVVAGRLWINVAGRAGRQLEGMRERRVGPQTTLLIPVGATARLNWRPGDYAAIDVAPMYRFHPAFGVGLSAGYWTKRRDHYSYRSAQDSVDVATRLGVPVPAAVLDPGTSQRWLRVGVVMTYAMRDVEGSFSLESTVSAAGDRVPAATVLRIVMRTSRWPF